VEAFDLTAAKIGSSQRFSLQRKDIRQELFSSPF
jgi:hypothetical protein